MNLSRNIPWPRILAEGGAIVVSILLAFGIEAWWSDRQDAAAERALLSSLQEEFLKLQDAIEWRRKYNEGIRESIRQLLRASIEPEDPPDDRDIDRLLAALWYNQELHPFALPVLSSAMSSGDLTLISNRQIRRNIAVWPVHMERVRQTMQRDLDFFSGRQMPYLSANVRLPQILAVEDHIPGHPNLIYEDEFSIKVESRNSHRHLVESPHFQNILLEREVLITDILYVGLWEDLDQDLADTLALISSELGD